MNKGKNQKLFDDDSEGERDHRDDLSAEHQTEDNRSNLVKKMFYKDQPSSLRKAPQSNQQTNSSAMPESVQKILDEKKEQLEKAMKFYNTELQKLNNQKMQLENAQKKLKLDQRELELNRKKQKESLEKMKEEELGKLKAQKRMLEQRQKNVALVNNGSKRDREELEMLKKQMTQMKEDAAQKERYNKSQIDRLNRQVNDLRKENQELRDEIAHYDQELREARESQFAKQEASYRADPQAPRSSGIGQGLGRKGSNSGIGAGSRGATPNAQG